MDGRWKEVAYKVGVFWVLIPVALGAMGYFAVAWWSIATKPETKAAPRPITKPAERPAPSDKEESWIMPDPPQIDITVEKVGDMPEASEPPVEAEPIEIEVPEGEEGDEAGVGGFIKPPVEGGGESGDTGTVPPPGGGG